MKITYTNGKLTAEAESVADVRTLLALADNKQTPTPNKNPKDKRGKWVHKVPCPKCGMKCKKGTGMASHLRMHKKQEQAEKRMSDTTMADAFESGVIHTQQ